MKLNGISVGNSHPKDSRTLEQFIGSEQAATPLGKLLVALAEETTWSNEYTVYASFGHDEPFVQVNHKTFLPSCSLMIYDDSKTVLSVRGVENAIRTHINDSREKIRPSIDILQGKMNDLYYASEQITLDKAKAAIVGVFGLTASEHLELYHETPKDLYVFGKMESECMLVARKIANDFVGGVARIPVSYMQWHVMKNGVLLNQRHGAFWAALARAFATKELWVLEETLRCEDVSVFEKPLKLSQPDPYVVEKVVFSYQKEKIVVEFGPDNLPIKAYVVPEVVQT